MKHKFKVLISKDTDEGVTIVSSCFHSSRSFVYCGLSNGSILCYDYSHLAQPGPGPVAELSGHVGPVRGLQCHPRHALLASGGDDTSVVVWRARDTADHRRMFTLRGHGDYVRCVAWHPTHPWLVTGSDDCTVRIWNWQSRSEVTVVTGCQHWLVSLALHPARDLLVTASLDMAVRVWDFSSLRSRLCNQGKHTEVATLFGVLDVVCEKVIESFTSPLVFVTIHPSEEVLAVGDRGQVTLYSLETLTRTGTLYGDAGLVGGAWQGRGTAGAGTIDSVVTLARDRVQVWGHARGTSHASLATDTRYQGLAACPAPGRQCTLAAWSPAQLAVFKVARERPLLASHGPHLYYVKADTIRHHNARTQRETVLFKLPPLDRGFTRTSLEYNPSEHSLILNYKSKQNKYFYQLFVIIDGVVNGKAKSSFTQGKFATWTANNRFAHLDDSNNIVVKNLDNKNVNFGGLASGFLLPKSEQSSGSFKHPNCERIFSGGGAGRVLLQDGDTVTLYDLARRRRLASAKLPGVRRVSWAPDTALLALASKRSVTICDAALKQLTSETVTRGAVKSLAWLPASEAEAACLLVSTETQVRFLLPSGHGGGLVSTREPLYLGLVTEAEREQLVGLNRRLQVQALDINTVELRFKAAVLAGKEQVYLRLIASGQLVGQSQLSFLREVGKPELAILFIKDPQTRFSLALEANDLTAASEAAQQLNDQESWIRLADLSLLHGDLRLAELCLQRARSYARLSFLYTLTGQADKLGKLARIFRVRGEGSQALAAALVTGDAESAAELLEAADQAALARLVRENCGRVRDLGDTIAVAATCGDNWPRVDTELGRGGGEEKKVSAKETLKESYRDQLKETFSQKCD